MPDTVGPILFSRGMDVGRPLHELEPGQLEQAINVFYDRGVKPRRRPGSIFHSRLSAGAILGLHEHAFATGTRKRKLVAVVADRYPSVTTHADPADDGVGQAGNGFCPNAEVHGTPIVPIGGRSTDRYVMESLFDRVYVAGSTSDYGVHFYDYLQGRLERIEAVRGTGVVAHNERLYVFGDPANPNYLFPSDFGDPEKFNLNLAIQIGTRNDRILAVAKADVLVVLADRSSHIYFGTAVELGELETATISGTVGVVGPLAVAVAPDGWVYWLDRHLGPVRWRRGMQGVETGFAGRVAPLWEKVAAGDLHGAAVRWDDVHHAVHFMIPAGGAAVPNYYISFFPALEAWTHNVKGELQEAVGLPFRGSPLREAPGEPIYTDFLTRRDPLDKTLKVYAGDDEGFIWTWRRHSPDKHRQSSDPGTFVEGLVRTGPLELAPVGKRALVHRINLDIDAPLNWLGELYVERDYRGRFSLAHLLGLQIQGGKLDGDFLLDDEAGAVLGDDRVEPAHNRLGMWKKGLAKALRFELRMKSDMAWGGVEFERTLSAEYRHSLAKAGLFPSDLEGVEIGPEDGQQGSEGDPVIAGPSGTPEPPVDELVAVSLTQKSFTLVNVANPSDISKITHVAGFERAIRTVTVADDGDTFWISEDGASSVGPKIYAYNMTNPASPTLLVSRDVGPDLFTQNPASRQIKQMWFDAANQRLIILVQVSGGSPALNAHIIAVYDVATRNQINFLSKINPSTNEGFGAQIVVDGLVATPDGRYAYYSHDRAGPTLGLHTISVLEISADGLTIIQINEVTSSSNLGFGDYPPVNKMGISGDGSTLAVAVQKDTSSTAVGFVSFWSLEDPTAPAFISKNTDAAVDDPNNNLSPIVLNKEGTRAYTYNVGTRKVLVFDVATGAKVGESAALSGNTFATEENISVDPDSDTLYWVQDSEAKTLDITTDTPVVLDTVNLGPSPGGSTVSCMHRYGVKASQPQPNPPANKVIAIGGGFPMIPDPSTGIIPFFGVPPTDGFALFMAVDDPADPASLSTIWRKRAGQFSLAALEDLKHVAALGPDDSTLYVFGFADDGTGPNARRAIEIARLEDNRLRGARGIQQRSKKLYAVGRDGTVLEIDVTDPAAPAVSAANTVAALAGGAIVDSIVGAKLLVLFDIKSVRYVPGLRATKVGIIDVTTLALAGSVAAPNDGTGSPTSLGRVLAWDSNNALVWVPNFNLDGTQFNEKPTRYYKLDISNPVAPAFGGYSETQDPASETIAEVGRPLPYAWKKLSDTRLLVGLTDIFSRSSEFLVYDATDLENLVLIGELAPGAARGILGRTADFVLDGAVAFAVANPENPPYSPLDVQFNIGQSLNRMVIPWAPPRRYNREKIVSVDITDETAPKRIKDRTHLLAFADRGLIFTNVEKLF